MFMLYVKHLIKIAKLILYTNDIYDICILCSCMATEKSEKHDQLKIKYNVMF